VKKENGEAKLELSDLEAAQAEVRRLRRALAIDEHERDILKKAVSIFSRMEP
jgi:transposase-like protein